MDLTAFMKIKDDSPLKLHKNVAIAKSGIYQYHFSELRGLFDGDFSIPEQHISRTIFNVLRPKEVLKDSKNLFIQLPLTREHPEDFVTPDNIRDEKTGWIGWTGDSSQIATLETEDEITINSTLNIVDKVGMNAYDNGIKEVSPGYIAQFQWKDGKDKNGTEYQIVMTKIDEVNHLALVDNGRGGKEAAILDHKSKETEMDEKTLKDKFNDFLKGMFGQKTKILDSMPKDIEKFTDEQKDYLLKETHRLLQHRVSGKSFDSFMPIGYTKDDMPDMAEDSKEDVEDTNGVDGNDVEGKAVDEDMEKKEDDKVEDNETTIETAGAEDTAAEVNSSSKEEKPAGGKVTTDSKKVTEVKTKEKTITVKIDDSKVEDNLPDPFAVAGQIRTGFKKENK
jgi:hypothetical protein